MADSRIEKLAEVLVRYSLEIKPGDWLLLRTSPVADELNLAFIKQAIQAGANLTLQSAVSGAEEVIYKYASDAQLEWISPARKMMIEQVDAQMVIDCDTNTRALSGIDPSRFAVSQKANAPLFKTFMERAAKKEVRWSLTVFPCNALAQEADMSLSDYQDFVYGADMLNEPDPVAFWKGLGVKQNGYTSWLKGHDQVVIKGSNLDLKLSIKERTFISCAGKENFPDGEIFTGPVEESVNGWVRFRYPAIEFGQEVTDIELWFENGRVVKETASKNQELLTSQLNTDPGARFVGEFGIGTNYGINRFTKHMLFDEKMGGTIHLALGHGYPESGSKNESGIHWDMLCDMNDAEMTADGETFYKNGNFTL